MIDRHGVARVLEEIGTLLELQGESPFRVRAFQNAARTLGALDGEIGELLRSGELAKVKGFGPATLEIVRELVETGVSSAHRELRERTPDGLLELLGVPGLGARRIHTLYTKLGIESLEDLERALGEGAVATLPGFGKKTQQKLLEGVTFLRSVAGRRRRPEALAVAAGIVELLGAHEDVVRLEVAGALRRGLETVDGLELVAAVRDAASVVDAFLELPGLGRAERQGEAEGRAWSPDGLEVRLRCVPPGSFVPALVHATGSPEHWAALIERAEAAGLRLDEAALTRGGAPLALEDEAALYAALGLAYLPPEMREGQGEIECAAAGDVPRLIAYGDLRGCFHNHTTYSDGRATVREMAEAALARGWRYLGIADHSRAAAYAGGLDLDEIARQHDEIDAWNEERGYELWLFKGIEADILPDGRLDYADEDEDVLARFDYVVGSVHSSFGLPLAEQTERVIRAMDNPQLTFLGHPTGRLLLSRRGYEIDIGAVIEVAAERGVAIEINSNPWRLDMDWRHWREAKERGVKTALNPDAHGVEGLDDVAYGVTVARKGWLTAEDVVNAWPLEEVARFFQSRRQG